MGEKEINIKSVRGLGCSMEVSNKGSILDECVGFGHGELEREQGRIGLERGGFRGKVNKRGVKQRNGLLIER